MNTDVNKGREGKKVRSKSGSASVLGTSSPAKGNGIDSRAVGLLRAQSVMIDRLQLANRAGLQYGGDRDLYTIFGYKTDIKPEDLLAKYARQDIASRIVDAPPSATWSYTPTIKDNEPLMVEWNKLAKATKLWGAMYRADRLARLNPFSLLLFGFDDSSELSAPVVNGVNELLYVRAIGSRVVEELEFDDDTRSPRFGMPKMYKIKFDDPKMKASSGGVLVTKGLKQLDVHWSRVVHVTDNPLEDMIFSTPILERVYNLLDDLLKVAGGTAEIFWLSGRGGLQVDIDKDLDFDPADLDDLEDELDDFMHQLRRYIRTKGITINPLESTVPASKEIFELIMALISGTTGIPRRILLGSEAGQLASEQDRANWAERITERRNLFATPGILDPSTELLQRVALLPEGDIVWEWPSAFIQNPLEEGQTMAQTARAVGNLARAIDSKNSMQILSEEESRGVLGFEGTIEDSDRFESPEIAPPTDQGQGQGSGGSPTREEVKARIAEEEEDE